MKKNEIEKKYYVFFRATDNGQQSFGLRFED